MADDRDEATKLNENCIELCGDVRRVMDTIEEFSLPSEDTIADYPKVAKRTLTKVKGYLEDMVEKANKLTTEMDIPNG